PLLGGYPNGVQDRTKHLVAVSGRAARSAEIRRTSVDDQRFAEAKVSGSPGDDDREITGCVALAVGELVRVEDHGVVEERLAVRLLVGIEHREEFGELANVPAID